MFKPVRCPEAVSDMETTVKLCIWTYFWQNWVPRMDTALSKCLLSPL